MYIHIYITTINEKEAMNLEKIKKGLMGEFKKERERINDVIILHY